MHTEAMRTFRAALALGLLVCVAAWLGGCRNKGGSSAEPLTRLSASTEKTFHYASIDEPKRLDPAFVKDLYEGIVSGLLYDGLVVFDKGTSVVPGLAERWESLDSGRRYVFHLRPAFFSDGRPVSSSDVRYSFTRVLLPETNSDRKWVLDRIEGAQEVVEGKTRELRGLRTPDPRTVEITLREPYPVFLTMLAMPTAAIIPEGAAGKDKPDPAFDTHPVGSGPWVLEKWLRDQRLEFRRNEHYWGEKPRLERLVYHVQADDAVRRQQFEIGNLDLYQVSFTVFPAWCRDPKRQCLMQAVQELRTDFVGFMNSNPKLRDARVRQAIAHAIDTRSIFDNLQRGRGVLAHGPIPPGVEGYRAELAPRAYDPDKARRLLAEAGVKTPLELEFWYRDEAQSAEIVLAIKADLAKVGIKVVPMPRDQASLRAGIWEGKPELYLGSWTLDYPDPENALVAPFHSRNIPRQGNGSHFCDAQIDRLLDEAQAEADPRARIEKYQKAEQAVIDQCPWVFLFHRKTYYAVRPQVRGFSPAVMYNADRFCGVEVK